MPSSKDSGLVKIAVVQMLSSMDFETNLKRIEVLIREACRQDVRAVFLPENFMLFANKKPRLFADLEGRPAGVAFKFIASLAAELNCWIFAGTIPLSYKPDGSAVEDGRVRAASLVFDNEGKQVARYDKVHLFDVDVEDSYQKYRESDTFEAGTSVEAVQTPFGLFGLTVCYDLRFPGLYQKLRAENIRSFVVPSAFTQVTGKAHFEILLRSRAIENTAFAIASCQGGLHDSGRETYGNSMVVNPWGDILARADQGEDIIYAELDYEQQDEMRKNMPVHLQRSELLIKSS